jgi:hypothetical protein
MNDNGNSTKPVTNETIPSRRVLGRGLKEILSEQSNFDDSFNTLQEHVKAARIGAAIMELVDIVDAKYHPVIFKSVTAYHTVAQGESTEVIRQKLHELESKRMHREKEQHKPKRLWYFLYLR